MKIVIAYVIFVILFAVLLKRERLPKLSFSLYPPLCWIVICLSRSLSQWLQFGGSLNPLESDMEGNSLDAVFLSILILIGLGILYRRRVKVFDVIKANKALFALYGLALVSVFWAAVPLIAFKRWTKWSGSLVLVLVVLSETDPKGAIRSIIKRTAYALIPLSVLFIKFVPRMGRSFTLSGGVDFHGVATQKNEYGLLLLIFGIYFAWELMDAWRRNDRESLRKTGLIDLFFLGVIFWQLIFIDSKTPMICLLLGIGTIFLIGRPYFRGSPKRVLRFILFLVVVGVLLQSFVDLKGRIITSAGRNPTLTDRTLLWSEVLKIPINPWLGTGWDNFWLRDRVSHLWEIWRWRPKSAHNGYIETYLYLGIPGVILLALVLFAGFKRSVNLFRTDVGYGSLALAFWLAALFQNYAESSFHRLSPMWFFLLLLSLVRMPEPLREREPDSPVPSP